MNLNPILDRRVQFDERSKSYPMRASLGPEKQFRAYSWRFIQLDQGQEGACVGHDVAMEAAANPKPFFGATWNPLAKPKAQIAAFRIYHRGRELDGVPDHVWPEGTSLLAGCKAGVEAGFWEGYQWALGPGAERAAKDVVLWAGYNGPVMLATNWYGSMFEANEQHGKLPSPAFKIAGTVAGGHAFLITRVMYIGDILPGGRSNICNWAVWTPNSWGGKGQGWIVGRDLIRLLDEDGEGAAPIVRKIEFPSV